VIRVCEKKRSLGRDYHPLCLKCQKCNRQLTAGQHAEYDEKPYCSHCYLKMFGPRGTLPSHYENTHTHIGTHKRMQSLNVFSLYESFLTGNR
uniref:LIM zinc-binding domain-containing protein n=1 Tax=Amphiprion ocellaris TaxID=80972 RepID=A0AAQ5Z697_AMPOC